MRSLLRGSRSHALSAVIALLTWALAAVPERVTSFNRLVMMKALRASMARTESSSSSGLFSISVLPFCSVTLLINQGLVR